MRVVRNIGHVKRRKRAAKRSAIVGFLLLMGPFFLISRPNLVLVAWALMLGGFVAFNTGMQQIARWAKTPRTDTLLDRELAKFNDKYDLFHYVQVGNRIVDHVLLHPGGLLVITARDLPGEVVGRGSRWRKRSSPLRRLFAFSGPQLGDPSKDTRDAIAVVEQALAANQSEVEVTGAIVFVNPLIRLDSEETDYEGLLLEELPPFVRALPPDESIRPADRERIRALLTAGEELELPAQPVVRRPVKRRRAA